MAKKKTGGCGCMEKAKKKSTTTKKKLTVKRKK